MKIGIFLLATLSAAIFVGPVTAESESLLRPDDLEKLICPEFNPAYEKAQEGRCVFRKLIYGHFMDSKAMEALVITESAIRSKTHWLFVLRNDGKKWNEVSRLDIYCDDVLSFKRMDGTDSIVCRSHGGGQGYYATDVYVLKMSHKKSNREVLARLESDDNFNQDYAQEELEAWAKIDVNNDGVGDLRLFIKKHVRDKTGDIADKDLVRDFIFNGNDFSAK